MAAYSVEIRESLRDGEDYSESHFDCNTPDEVKEVIADMHEDERLHSVLYYGSSTSNPKDVTSQFVTKKRRK